MSRHRVSAPHRDQGNRLDRRPTTSGSTSTASSSPCHIRAINNGQPRSTEAARGPTSTHFDVDGPAPSYDSQAEYAGSIPVIGSTIIAGQTARGTSRLFSCTITGSPMLTVLKYHSASSVLRLMQPWLTFSNPSELTAHGAECTKRPRLVIRTA